MYIPPVMLTRLSILTTYLIFIYVNQLSQNLIKSVHLEPSTHVEESVPGSRRRQHKVSGVEERLKNVTTVQRMHRSIPYRTDYILTLTSQSSAMHVLVVNFSKRILCKLPSYIEDFAQPFFPRNVS